MIINTKTIARVEIMKDKTFILLKQLHLRHNIIILPDDLLPIFYTRKKNMLHCWFLQYICIDTKLL